MSKNFDAILAEVLYQRVPITINGKRKHVSVLEAMLRQAVSRAVASDWRYFNLLMKHLSRAEVFSREADDNLDDGLLSLETINALLDKAEATGELPD